MDEIVIEVLKRIFPQLSLYINSISKVKGQRKKHLDSIVNSLLNTKKNIWLVGKTGTGKTTSALYAVAKILEKQNEEKLKTINNIKKEDNYLKTTLEEMLKEELKQRFIQSIGFLHIPELFINIESHRFDSSFSVPSPDVVILDDLGWESASLHTAQFFGVWIEKRYASEKKHIITTNFQPEDLYKKDFFAKTIDRLLESATIIQFENKNFRRQNNE